MFQPVTSTPGDLARCGIPLTPVTIFVASPLAFALNRILKSESLQTTNFRLKIPHLGSLDYLIDFTKIA
jgi:hypothetical protein